MLSYISRTAQIRRSALVACQPLESRMLLSLSPAGPEFRVNTFTPGTQTSPAMAVDGDGDFVVAWQSDSQEGGGGSGIFAQRYSAAGVAQGGEIHVNTLTPSTEASPAVGMDADGDFVVVWSSTDVVNGGIRGQRYNAAGVPQGTEFSVSSFGGIPSVATDVSGNFVVAWQAFGVGNSDVFFRRYDSAGASQSAAVRANSYLTSVQLAPAVAIDADGDFVVAWESYLQDGSDYGVYAQRFNSAGDMQGAEFRVHTFTTSTQRAPAVAMDLSGDFVLTWSSYGQDGSSDGVYAKRYNASGVAQGAEFRVNTVTTNSQSEPAVALDADGDFFITWSSVDGSSSGVYAQQFSAAGAPVGGELQINTFTTNSQFTPAVAADPNGDLVVAWTSLNQDGNNYGVYAQRYDESNPDTAGPIVGGVFVNGKRVKPYSLHEPALQQIVVSFSETLSVAGGAGGANSVTNPNNWLITRDGIQLNPAAISITFGYNASSNRYEALITLPAAYTTGNFAVRAKDAIRDLAGNTLDGDFSGASSGQFDLAFSIGNAFFGARGSEFRVNSTTSGSQINQSVAADADGDFIVVWDSGTNTDGSGLGVYAQRYDAKGLPQGVEFLVNTYTTNNQAGPSVAMDAAGNFVVAWHSLGQDGFDNGVYAQRYNAAGVRQGGEFRVNTTTAGSEFGPQVAMDETGDFVVVWVSANDGSLRGIYAQRFNSTGAAQGGEFRVNTYTTHNQDEPSVAMDATGNFLVAWDSGGGQDGELYGVYARRYNSVGASGAEFRVNTYTTGGQRRPSVGMTAGGEAVIAWDSFLQDGSGSGVFAQRYDSSGFAAGGEFRVNLATVGEQFTPSVGISPDGFVVAWRQVDGSGDGVAARRFDSFGTPLDSGFTVNTFTSNNQMDSQVGMDDEGDFVVVWESDLQDGSAFGIYAQRYAVSRTPTVGILTDSPDSVELGTPVLLSASNISDDGTVASVGFYRESNGVAGLQVGFQGDTLVGTANTNVGGVWSINAPTTGLTPGTYTYWAQATDDSGLIGKPASTTNTITGANPALAVNSSALEFQTRQAISITFNNPLNPVTVSASDLAALNLDNASTPVANSVILSAGNTVATWVFNTAGTFISDGDYRFTLPAGAVADTNGNILATQHQLQGAGIFFFAGDANRDHQVNLTDYNTLAANFNQSPRIFNQGDFNYDTLVNIADYNILAGRYGTVVGPEGELRGSPLVRQAPSLFWAREPVIMGHDAEDVLQGQLR